MSVLAKNLTFFLIDILIFTEATDEKKMVYDSFPIFPVQSTQKHEKHKIKKKNYYKL